MGIILCQKESVNHPFYIESLGIHIHSAHELCYVIFHYPLIALDNFIGEGLIRFISSELNMGMLALKLERGISSGEDMENLLLLILQECDYYSAAEVGQFQKKMINLQNMNAADYAKAKADDLVERKQYGKAIVQYETLLNNHGENYQRSIWRGEVWNNLGVVYARLYQFDNAAHAFEKAYGYLKNINLIKQIYFLLLMQPNLSKSEEYQALINEEHKAEWDQEFKQLKFRVQSSADWKQLNIMFKKDSMKRRQQAEKLLEDWKRDYRRMV